MDRGYDYKKFTVLYVDDEEQALKYFGRAYSKDFEVVTSSNAAKASDYLDSPQGASVGVLISDQRMPGQSGVDLLTKVRRTRPEIVRILTTAYTELDDAIDAVNSGAVFHYVSKPWNVRELRGVLLRAMEFFLVQRERDLLLREKLSVLQRMIILDRVRSCTVLAASLACRVRNSMTALKAFFDFVPVSVGEKVSDASVDWGDLWDLAQTESQRLVEAVDEIVHTTMESDYTFTSSVLMNDLTRQQIGSHCPLVKEKQLKVEWDLVTDLPQIVGDQRMLTRLVAILSNRLVTMTKQDGAMTVRTTYEQSIRGQDVPGVRLLIRCDVERWTARQIESLFSAVSPSEPGSRDMGMDVLTAFFIAHHHGGDLLIHPNSPLGPGFEVLLPLDPENAQRPPLESDWMNRLFTNFEAWGRLNAGV